uniref:HP n=1 Tax=Pestalotiopsis theae chrysovirus 1 TaxID=2855487 RepID=A0A6M2VKK4_9VIRU|nr:HP [Pestalotiopsis theae chrysovirus 1]
MSTQMLYDAVCGVGHSPLPVCIWVRNVCWCYFADSVVGVRDLGITELVYVSAPNNISIGDLRGYFCSDGACEGNFCWGFWVWCRRGRRLYDRQVSAARGAGICDYVYIRFQDIRVGRQPGPIDRDSLHPGEYRFPVAVEGCQHSGRRVRNCWHCRQRGR